MMATLQNKEEYGKGPKKTFAPPVQKLHRLMPLSPNSLKEDTREISSPEAEATASLPKARLEKKNEKAHTENGPGSGQEERGKNLCNKQAEGKVEKERTSLTNAEFEEIVQIVLQKSLQECLGSDLGFAETSCVRPIGYTQSGKERGIASITAASDSADGVPHTPEISASQENGVVPQINTSKPSQPDPGASEKKFSRLSLNKRKKEVQHGRWETFQSGHQRRQKDQLKKTDQDHSQIREQQQDQFVVWVQCSSPNCEKWRRLHGNIDPSTLPDNWSCAQNIDLEHNRCDIPEETWTGHESDVVYASYVPGSIIWAKQYGYPWWPGMVESDPDLGEYFLFASHLDSLPSKYHVTYFGDAVSRAWIPVSMLRNFQELSLEQAGVKKYKNKDCIQKLEAALKMAQEAEQVNIQERVNLFGFHSRYNRFESPGEGKDLMLSGPNSSNSRFEKEEEVESEMEEEEEKKDPTLPVPKPPRIQTKKPKPRGGDTGLADGQDGALQKKTKRSLGDESPAPPVLLKERKEGRRDSDPHQPGPKRKFKAPQSKSLVTSSSKERVGGMVPKGLAPPAPTGACPMMEIEGPGPREPLCWEAGGAAPEDEASSDLDLEQLLEDVGEEPEPREESLRRDAGEDVTMALLEE